MTTSRPGSKELIQGIGHVSGLNSSDKTQSLSTVLMLLGNKDKKDFLKNGKIQVLNYNRWKLKDGWDDISIEAWNLHKCFSPGRKLCKVAFQMRKKHVQKPRCGSVKQEMRDQ